MLLPLIALVLAAYPPDTRVCYEGLIIQPVWHAKLTVHGSCQWEGPHYWLPYGDPALSPMWGHPPTAAITMGSVVTVHEGARIVYHRDPPGCAEVYVFDFVSPLDFDGDGDASTDADIEAFFACITDPACASADFDCDGDRGTDGDVEAFFRCLGGGC